MDAVRMAGFEDLDLDSDSDSDWGSVAFKRSEVVWMYRRWFAGEGERN